MMSHVVTDGIHCLGWICTGPFFAAMVRGEVKDGLGPVLIPVSPSTAALLGGVAKASIKEL